MYALAWRQEDVVYIPPLPYAPLEQGRERRLKSCRVHIRYTRIRVATSKPASARVYYELIDSIERVAFARSLARILHGDRVYEISLVCESNATGGSFIKGVKLNRVRNLINLLCCARSSTESEYFPDEEERYSINSSISWV